jgi:Pectate lyase superfamily protein
MRERLAAAFVLGALACGREPPGAEVEVRAQFASAPAVRCIRITAAGAVRVVSRDFGVPAGNATQSLILSQVPTGDVLVTGTAFDATCPEASAQHPTWIASPVVQTLQSGVPASFAMVFHPNGESTVTAQFTAPALAGAAPADASCLRVAVAGATRTVERRLELGATVFDLSELPTGEVLFLADAFASPCSAVTPQSAQTWHADAVAATLTAGVPAGVTVELRPSARPSAIAVSVSPAVAFVAPGGILGFAATVTGTAGAQSTAVTWSVQEPAGGTIDSSGRYTAPASEGMVHVVATAVADPSKSGVAIVYVETSPTIPADRLVAWTPGIQGGIPARTAVCGGIVSAETYDDGGQDASAGIQAAIDACPPGQVVQLSAGTFTIDGPFLIITKGITLRGAGAGRTILQRTNGAKPGTPIAQVTDPIVIVGPNRFPRPDNTTSQDLTADAPKGASSVTVADASAFGVGEIVLLDEDNYFTGSFVGLPNRNGAPTTVQIWETDRAVWQQHNPTDPFVDDPFPAALSWFSRSGRPVSEIKEVAAVDGKVVTFTTPLTIGYRTSHTAQLTRYTGISVHVKDAGVEELTLTGGGDGNIRFVSAADSWMKGVEDTLWLGEGVSIVHSFRIEVRRSYIHDGAWQEPGGGGYAISLAAGSSEILIEDNIVLQANKVIVSRAAGAGSVVGYNYMDDAQIHGTPLWQEVGLNGSHMVGSHHMLFEGNESFNYDSDCTHGNAIYHTVFRNHLSGFRRDHPDDPISGNARTAGLEFGAWWHSFVGNVLGTAGRMAGWVYQDLGDAPGPIPWSGGSFIWRLGYDPAHFEQGPDPQVQATVLRHGNFDFLTDSVVWDPGIADHTLPPSLYLSEKPAFFAEGSGYAWPWVDPTSPVPLATLPARARFDAGTPFQQP